MKRRWFFVSVSLLLSLLLVISGCSSSSSGGGGSSSPAAGQSSQGSAGTGSGQSGGGSSSAPSQSDKTFNLIASTHSPPGIPMTDAWDAFLNEIEARSNGRITFERYYNGALSDGYDVVDKISTGVIDVALLFPEWQSGRMHLNSIGALPALYEHAWVGTKAMTELYKTTPELQQEAESVGVVSIGFLQAPPQYFVSTKPINGFDDLKGQRVQTLGPGLAIILQSLGMTPVSVPFTDAYDALTRGTIDTVTLGVTTSVSFGLHEAAKYAWRLPLIGIAGSYAISKKVWDDMPDDLKAIIEEVRDEFQPDSFYQIYVAGDNYFEEVYKNAGGTIVEPTPEDVARLKDIVVDTVWQDWVNGKSAIQADNQAILDRLIQLLDQYEKENPFQ